MYETERLILSVILLVVLVSWDKDNLPITIVIITGLIFNIVSVIYKSIVYKQNDKKNNFEKSNIFIFSVIYLVLYMLHLNN